MYRKWLPIISFMLLVMVPPAAHAQSWSGIIDPSRAVDWSNGSAGVDDTGPRLCKIGRAHV